MQKKKSFRFSDTRLQSRLLKKLRSRKIPFSVGAEGGIIYDTQGNLNDRIERAVSSVRGEVFPTWQLLFCPEDWVTRYAGYMEAHGIKYIIEIIDGKETFLLSLRYRPHAWKNL